MKRFAVILIIAVLALGCVFATTSKNSTNSNSIWVTTQIQEIYPVYQLKATNGKATKQSAAGETDANKITGKLDDNQYNLSINVELDHFGLKDNEAAAPAADTIRDIRYMGTVKVTIEAGKLINTYTKTNTTADDRHVAASADPTVGDTTWSDIDSTNCAVDVTTSSNTVTATAKYNGKIVELKNDVAKIAIGSFKWDVSTLTPGDTYKAEIKISYTVE